MSISQRISKKAKQKLDEIQARFVLERVNDQKMNIPELIDQMTDFIDEHFDQFKQQVANKTILKDQDMNEIPDFLEMTVNTNAPGSHEDYTEYNFNDV